MQTILAYVFLACGAFWLALLLSRLTRDMRPEEGGKSLSAMLVSEAAVFFIATTGISDFLMNTILFNRYGSGKAEKLPGTLMLSTVVPGTVIAFSYLRGAEPIEVKTLILCTAGMVAGAITGGMLVEKLNGKALKKILGFALIFSMLALIVKMIISSGTSGAETGLTGWRLITGVALGFVSGAFNMVGVPAKPTLTAAFLLLGLSPMCTLTLLLVMCGLTPIGAGFRFLKNVQYHRKTVLAAATAGTAAAAAGSLLMISLPAMVLNVILLTVMLIAIIVTFKPEKA